MVTHPDGETNDAKLVPALLPQVREQVAGTRLWVADRQFCDLTQTAAFAAGGDHFLVRYHPKTHFCPDPTRPAQPGQDAQGRAWVQDWGWLGCEQAKQRRFVRRLTLYRPGEETIILLTDLLDAAQYPANDLFDLYLARWGIERVFQQITEVFHLQTLIGTTPQGTVFQLAFCLLLYNLVQVVRAYVATAQARPVTTISTELLFDDVHRQLVAFTELVSARPGRAVVPPPAVGGGPPRAVDAPVGHRVDLALAQGAGQETESPHPTDADSRQPDVRLPTRRCVSQTKSDRLFSMTFTAVGNSPEPLQQRELPQTRPGRRPAAGEQDERQRRPDGLAVQHLLQDLNPGHGEALRRQHGCPGPRLQFLPQVLHGLTALRAHAGPL